MEITFKFRPWSYARSLSRDNIEHFLTWSFGFWYKDNVCGVYENTGLRVFGIELNLRKYLFQTH